MSPAPLRSRIEFSTPGRVTLRTGKVELGQGIWTALRRMAASALVVAPERIDVPPVSTADAPDEGHTAGSLSIQTSGMTAARACRQARLLLTRAAAEKLGVAADSLEIRDGRFFRDGAETGLDYWSLRAALDDVLLDDATVAIDPDPDPAGDIDRSDLRAKVTGAAFIQDLTLAGMQHARMVRPPEHGGRLAGLDAASFAQRYPEARLIVDGSVVAVVCTQEEEAVRAAEWLRSAARWDLPPATPDLGEVTGWLPAATDDPAPTAATAATAPSATTERAPPHEAAGLRHSATYSRPAIAHASIAPSCALAWEQSGRLDIWTHSQAIFFLRDAIAAVLGRDPTTVTVTHLPGAGCYGHNGADDVAFDAALVAVRLAGLPIRLSWSREEELAWSPVGAPMVVRIDAALSGAGRVIDWTLELWSAPHARRPGIGGPNLVSATMLARPTPIAPAHDIPPQMGGGAGRNAAAIYDFPEARVISHLAGNLPIRTSSLRSLGAHCNIFAIESMMDELAISAGVDPLLFRLNHLSDPRARRVLETAAGMSGWGSAPARGRTRGLAMARYKNTSGYAAVVAEVSAEDAIHVHQVWCAADVGRVVSRDGTLNQIEGGIIQSISWALCESAALGPLGVRARSWKDYAILRFSQIPRIHVQLASDPAGTPLGAGEIVQGPATAALANAASAALGTRLRHLPLTRDRVMAALAAAP